MLLARLRTTAAVTRSFQTRGIANMFGAATMKTEKAAAEAAEAAQPQELGDIVLDGFAKRQFEDKTYSGTQIDFDRNEFVKKVNEIYEANNKQLVDGYAPFCKHLFIKNFTGARLNMVAITQANAHMLMSDYDARTEYELPVPQPRRFPVGIVSIKAQDEDHELPMKPITMMRNAVGKEQGGSGVPLDRGEYMKAVEYWRNHAVIKKM
ncbi:hypothetical protein GN244_ATG20562 [Phytophthora infestans]|uniref:Uncharacterized protein n=1 Tax=Phytophthora infestans TaxID=4787 RepID=A0A833SGM2_PHYIN|nr:hypothetical protein GN244_ATG20562 [Phytophthora infestans]